VLAPTTGSDADADAFVDNDDDDDFPVSIVALNVCKTQRVFNEKRQRDQYTHNQVMLTHTLVCLLH
jgi:hypothetical protein